MDLMTDPYLWSGQNRTLTVEDMENMPDDQFRYELDDGVQIVSPERAIQRPRADDAPVHREVARA